MCVCVGGGGLGLQYVFYISLGSCLNVEFEKGSGVKFRAYSFVHIKG